MWTSRLPRQFGRWSPDHRSLASHTQDAQDKQRDAHWSRSQVLSQAMQITAAYNKHLPVRQVPRSASPESEPKLYSSFCWIERGCSIQTEKFRCVLLSPQKTSSVSSPLRAVQRHSNSRPRTTSAMPVLLSSRTHSLEQENQRPGCPQLYPYMALQSTQYF